MMSWSIAQQQQVIGSVFVMRSDVERHHAVERNLRDPVPREQSVSLHIEKFTFVWVGEYGWQAGRMVSSIQAQKL
jgi:hypothetical protein